MPSPTALDVVRPHLPAAAVGHVADLLAGLGAEVRIAAPRRTKLGDHRPPGRGVPGHRISVNGDLNPYAFLTTLLHEIAHAAAWERMRSPWRQRPHGPAWQRAFADVLRPLLASDLLPDDVARALTARLERPAAATCSDRGLLLALARYDAPRPGRIRVEDLAAGTLFRSDDGLVFRAAGLLRTRRRCFTWPGGREYRVHGLAFVEPLAAAPPAPAGRRRRA